MADDNRYGNGNPPYSLYQGDDELWGLVDKDGRKLPAVFNRNDDRFSCVPWEVVMFNPDEGFDLLAWYDPCEVWFNFTFDDPRYPAEYGKYLWKKPDKEFAEYEVEFRRMLPCLYWMFDCIVEAERILGIDDEDEYHTAITNFLGRYPQLNDIADYNNALDPIMQNTEVNDDMKAALWRAKVMLDANVRLFHDEISEQLDTLQQR
ncbi:MAG: hypothetical protein NC453_18485 [Muribaculum sp.]|nr:hypothetical protein [Muribaculum sp.]